MINLLEREKRVRFNYIFIYIIQKNYYYKNFFFLFTINKENIIIKHGKHSIVLTKTAYKTINSMKTLQSTTIVGG